MNTKATWLVNFEHRPEALTRLFCLPYAGGGASAFAHWSRVIENRIEIFSAQMPGRESRIQEEPCTSLAQAVDALLEEMEPLLDKPYCIYGHSLGARIGFEICHELSKRQWPLPIHFCVAASSAPQLGRRFPALSHLPTSEFIARLRQYGAELSAIEDKDIQNLILPMLRSDFRLVETYHCDTARKPLPIATTLFGGDNDPIVSTDDLSMWNQVTKVVSTEIVEGDHFFIKNQSDIILDRIVDVLLRE